MMHIPEQINSYSQKERLDTLKSLANNPELDYPANNQVNLHVHSFFSYNAQDWSPSRIALEAKRQRLAGIGIIDFDVIDAQQEIFRAGEILSIKTSLGLETRTYYDTFADVDIDSPGEPGVSYVSGAGFVNAIDENAQEFLFLNKLKETARDRNIKLIQRINKVLPDINIDYENDVLSLTPSGNATERHIVQAYINKTDKIFPDIDNKIKFWNDTLKVNNSKDLLKNENRPVLENVVRSKFAKHGGIGYVQPSEETFPPVAEVFQWISECGAIPLESWLDGTSEGEKDPQKLLESSISKGAKGLNIIPDRNWNIADPETQKIKYQNLKNIINTANNMGLPIHIGTEMNKDGQPFFDDLENPYLTPFREIILKGAHIVFGHNLLTRFAGFSYGSKNADAEFKGNLLKQNNFFEKIGLLPVLSEEKRKVLSQKTKNEAFSILTDSSEKEKWII